MLFDKVNREYILLGIKDYDKKGLPNGFGPSSTYDLIDDYGKMYPPKAIMAYANYHASGRKIERYFKGGDNTECFKVLREHGFQVLPKHQEMEQINVKQEFAEWLLKNAPDSYSYYLGGSINSVKDRINEINAFFPEADFFEINSSKVDQKIQEIRFLFSTKERRKKPEFLEYDKFHSSGIPKAIMGKNNYIKFLYEKFKTMDYKENEIFTWVQTHKELANYLLTKENDQQGLINLLKSIDISPFNDQDITGNTIPLEVIDPFTFFCYIYKYGDDRRLLNIQNIAKKSNLTVPKDERGIPSAYAQKVWLFPFKKTRTNNEIPRLWRLFKSALNNTISEEQFLDILKIKGVGKTKITEGLFYIMPDSYFPLNGPSKPFIKEVFGINPEFATYTEYQYILNQLKVKSNKPFYELSHDAWLWSDQKRNGLSAKNDQISIFDSFESYLKNLPFLKPYSKSQISSKVSGTKTNVLKYWKREFKEEFNPFEINKSKLNWLYKLTQGSYEGSFNGKQNFRDFINELLKETEKNMEDQNNTLNTILFGPPGTGKTYTTINESLQIVDPEYYNENKNERSKLNERFKELLIKDFENTKGQIAFCTFHQSFTYEDFVEGIKPKTNKDKEVYYEIEPGIFQNICQLAESSISAIKFKKEGKFSWDENYFKNAAFYKISLGDSNKREDNEIYEYCKENNCIVLGYGDENDFSGLSETEITNRSKDLDYKDNVGQSLNYFIHYLKKGNYVIVGKGNKYVRAIGKVTGDYFYEPNSPISYNHFRGVEWLFTDENIPIEELYDRSLSQQTIYKIDETGLKKDFFTNKGQEVPGKEKKEKNYVLIIDEINRGNVSSIFGELITLIEPDKRAGREEELEVSLPYSKEPFKVPHNVYIIGTMNTADRSIEALDTALRRRFSFKEMPPESNLILKEGNSGLSKGIVDGINLKGLLDKINGRIEKLIDKDHKIGHSYFLKVHNLPSLKYCFKNEVIPLLEEYFFGDYGKIGLVLGDSFIEKDNGTFEFANFEGYDKDVSSDLKERSVYKIKDSEHWKFNSI